MVVTSHQSPEGVCGYRLNSVKTFTRLSSALTLGVLLAGQVTLAAPFSYEYNDTISSTIIAGLSIDDPVKIIVTLDNGGTTPNSQTWNSSHLTAVIFNFNNNTECTTFSTPFDGGLLGTAGSFASDGSGNLTAVMSNWSDMSIGTDYTTNNGGIPNSWFLNGGNSVYSSSGNTVSLTNVGDMSTASNWASSAVSGCYALSVNTTGTGTGIVTGNGSYAEGDTVTLTATPNTGSTFSGWSPSPCADSFTMPANNLTCTATFNLDSTDPEPTDTTPVYIPPPPPPETKVIVSFGGNGKGKVTSNPSGIDCQSPYACSYEFKTFSTIQLTPQAIGSSRFQNWGTTCNNGIISASGRTVYCTVYFVDLTPPPVVEVEPEPVVTPEPEPVIEPTPEPVVEPEPVVTPEPVVEPEPVITPEQEPIVEPAPVVEPELPPTDDTTEPVAEPAIKEPPVVEEPVDMTPEPEPDVIPEPVEILPPVNDESCPPKDSLSYYCNAGGQTIGDLNIVENPEATNGVGFLSNAVIIGTVQLADKTWISNLHVTEKGIVIGGTVTGLNHNDGYIGDFIFKGEFIKGGKLGGKIFNLSKIFSWFEDVTLTANAHLIGGALKSNIKGDPKNPALLENLRILSGSVVSGVIIGNGVKIDKDVKIEESIQDDTSADEAELPALDKQFSAGIGVNDSSYQIRNVAQILSDNVSIRGKIHVNKKHVGQKAKIFVTVAYRFNEDSAEEFLFTINQLSGLMPWNGDLEKLGEEPFREETLQTSHTVKIYDGILLATGVVKIQFGYLSSDGTVVQSSESIELVTTE